MKGPGLTILKAAALVTTATVRAGALWVPSTSLGNAPSASNPLIDLLMKALAGLALLYGNLLLVAAIFRLRTRFRPASEATAQAGAGSVEKPAVGGLTK